VLTATFAAASAASLALLTSAALVDGDGRVHWWWVSVVERWRPRAVGGLRGRASCGRHRSV